VCEGLHYDQIWITLECCVWAEVLKLNDSTLLVNAPRFPKDHCFSEGSQASPICLSAKSNRWMKMSMEHWWNDTDRGKQKYWERNPSQEPQMLRVLARRHVPQNSNAIIVRSRLKLLTLACTLNCDKLNWPQRSETNQTKRRQICHHRNNLVCVSTNALPYRQFNIQ